MRLPVLQVHHRPGREDLIRYYHRTVLHWCRQLADEAALDTGTALTSAALANVADANLVLDASIPQQGSAAECVAEVEAHFRAEGVRCARWVLNPALPGAPTRDLAEHLLSLGYREQQRDILYLSGQPAGVIEEVGGLQIIPARASFRHARELLAEQAAASGGGDPQWIEAGMLHLEDPQTDALIALKDGAAAALVSVLTVGEIGCVEDLFVAPRFRRQGIGRTMMSRALEICARSLFKHVFLSCEAANAPATALYASIGFNRIGTFTDYRAPSRSSSSTPSTSQPRTRARGEE
jgi:ribosomal protein S18 acetylase RimI-like enzyme